jgi:hypothetical protein
MAVALTRRQHSMTILALREAVENEGPRGSNFLDQLFTLLAQLICSSGVKLRVAPRESLPRESARARSSISNRPIGTMPAGTGHSLATPYDEVAN